MNSCLVDILDPKAHTKTPCKAYLTFMSIDGFATPHVRCYANNCGKGELAVLMWIAECAIEQMKNDVPNLKESVDFIKAAAKKFGITNPDIFNSESTQISILKDAVEDETNDT